MDLVVYSLQFNGLDSIIITKNESNIITKKSQ